MTPRVRGCVPLRYWYPLYPLVDPARTWMCRIPSQWYAGGRLTSGAIRCGWAHSRRARPAGTRQPHSAGLYNGPGSFGFRGFLLPATQRKPRSVARPHNPPFVRFPAARPRIIVRRSYWPVSASAGPWWCVDIPHCSGTALQCDRDQAVTRLPVLCLLHGCGGISVPSLFCSEYVLRFDIQIHDRPGATVALPACPCFS